MVGRITERRRPVRAAILLSLLLIAIVIYCSLYPFNFVPLPDAAATREALVRAWRFERAARGDMAANLLFYAPLGLSLSLAMARLPALLASVLAVLLCALLSLAMEGSQIFVPGRVASGSDLVLNTIGAALGTVIGIILAPARASDALAWRPELADRFAAMLLGCWLAYRLYPYVPALDIGEWRASVKTLLLPFQPDLPRTLRLTLLWLVAARTLEATLPAARHGVLLAAIMLGTVAGVVPLVDRYLTHEEVLAVGIALPAWLLLRHIPRPGLDRVLLPLMLGAVLLEGLSPYLWLDERRPFGWIPLRSLVIGQLGFGVQAVLYKFVLYGGLAWLGKLAGLRLQVASGLAVLVALAVSVAQTWLPGRSAETTDAALALGAGVILWLLQPRAAPGRLPAQ